MITGLGIVSNSWAAQLAGGASIVELAARAVELGYRAIELRQGSLGEATASNGSIEPTAVLRLAKRYAGVRWYVAMELAYSRQTPPADERRFEQYAAAASCVGEGGCVRIVDLSAEDVPQEASNDEVASRLADMARQAAAYGVRLAVEHARQDWKRWLAILRRARERVGDPLIAPLVCYDPANLHLFSSLSTAQQAVRELNPAEMGLVHAKQTVRGTLAATLQAGDVDWADQLAVLEQAGYQGPINLELPPGDDIWERLARGRQWLGL
ncbi:MAG: sugar phosphate isomerase/epimerase [Pirellulales bacterium]|nr:sugar phosphate isomerase/epimerase [Pirellulales bacterium]